MCIHSKLKSSRWYQKCLHTFFEITTTDNFLGKNNVLRKRCFQKLGSQCASVTGWRPPKQRHKKRSFMQKPSPRSHHADALLQVDIPCSCYSSLLALLGSLPAHSIKLFGGWKVSGLFVNQLQFLVYHFQRIQGLLTPKFFRSSGLFVNQPQFLVNIFKEFNASSLQNCSGARDCLWTSYNLFIILNINGQITIAR